MKVNQHYSKSFLIALMGVTLASPVHASCATYLGSGTCETNSRGHKVITEQNLSGGYTSTNTTTQDRSLTSQQLNGGYRTEHSDGSYTDYNYNPYGGNPNNNGTRW